MDQPVRLYLDKIVVFQIIFETTVCQQKIVKYTFIFAWMLDLNCTKHIRFLPFIGSENVLKDRKIQISMCAGARQDVPYARERLTLNDAFRHKYSP